MTTSAQILLPDNTSILLPSDGAPDSILTVLAKTSDLEVISVESIREAYLEQYSAPVKSNVIPYIETDHGDVFNANWYYTLTTDCLLEISTYWPEDGEVKIQSPYNSLESLYDEAVPEHRGQIVEAITKLMLNNIYIPGVCAKPSEMLYMTNMCCEVATITPAVLDEANLHYQPDHDDGFYPLTAEEEVFIAEDMTYVNGDQLYVNMSQTVLFNNRKYLCLTHSEHYGEDQTKAEALESHRNALSASLSLASSNDRIVTWTDQPDHEYNENSSDGCSITKGDYSTFILIPFDDILKTHHSFESLWESLKPAV